MVGLLWSGGERGRRRVGREEGREERRKREEGGGWEGRKNKVRKRKGREGKTR